MKLQLIDTLTDPPTRVTRAIGGYLPQRPRAEGQVITAPEGHAYIPILDRPEHDPETQRLERQTTLDGDGWRLVDLTADEIAARNPPPETVTRRQLFLVLASLPQPITRSMIRAMLDGNEAALIEFEEALSFDRTHPLISQLAAQLGMTDEQVDQLFQSAATL